MTIDDPIQSARDLLIQLKDLRQELEPMMTKANQVSSGLQMNLIHLDEEIERLQDVIGSTR